MTRTLNCTRRSCFVSRWWGRVELCWPRETALSEGNNTAGETWDQGFVGARLAGRYRLESILGKGGMGVVYEAVQEDLGRRVAIKLISGSVSSTGLARLRQEAEATARLGNPHIVQVTDFQSNPGEPPFLVMELLHGRSLRALLKAEGVIGWQRAARFGCQILEALAAAHAAGIIHRDIKPDNVFVLASAAVPDMVKVLDFGVAKLVADDARGMTAPGALLGTLAYMSPEVTRGNTIDPRSDLYAVAVSLYEAVAGRRPIEAHDLPALFAAIAYAEPVPLQRICPHVPQAFADVLMRSLRKSPDERFQLASEMATALAACLGSNVEEPARTALGGYHSASSTRGAEVTAITAATDMTAAPRAPSGVTAPNTRPLPPSPPAFAAAAHGEEPNVVWSWPSAPAGSQGPARPSFGSPSHLRSGPALSADPLAHRAKLARDVQWASTWSLVCAIGGFVTCLFPASIAGIVLGARAHRLGRQQQAFVPLRATAAIIVGIAACLGSLVMIAAVSLVRIEDNGQKTTDDRIGTLEKSIGARAGATVLERDTGCALAEIQVLRKGHDGHSPLSTGAFLCNGALTQTKERAQLAGFAFDADFTDYAVNVCFTKAATWSVSELHPEACPGVP